jgi:hypothetical protein
MFAPHFQVQAALATLKGVVALMSRVKRVGKLLGYMSMSTICADP